MKSEEKVKQGKKNRAKGGAFELRVRKDLEEKGWIVTKWMNNVSDYPENNINLPPEERADRKLIPAKRKYNPFNKALSIGTGFPDFIAYTFKQIKIDVLKLFEEEVIEGDIPTIIGVEAKSNGYLDKEEKAKCQWLLENNIFSKILIAKKGAKRGVIEYKPFVVK